MIKTYSISTDFSTQSVNLKKLTEEIEANENISTSLDYINTDSGNCYIYFDGDLSESEITALNSIVANHDGNIYDFKEQLCGEKQACLNYNFFGLYKEEVIDAKGNLVEVNMYHDYNPSTQVYSDLAIKDEYVYYFNELDLVTHRVETLTWYLTDNSIGYVKVITKYYDLNSSIKEGVRRRQNLLDKAKTFGLVNIAGTHASGVPNSYYWFSTMQTEVRNYVDGTLKQQLIDFIDNSTESYVTQYVKDGMTDILDYWTT